MNSFIHREKTILKKQLLTLVLACAMLISAAPLQAMALDEKQAEQGAELPVTANNVQNGGFESGDLTGWTVLTKGFDASSAVVNERTYWAQELPYNQSGSYHLNGWNTGIPEAEGWAVRSSTFVLGGSGYISVKMGGNAAVAKVFLTDGTQVGYYRNFRFHDVNFPYISKGGAWCDMATYVIDLSDYLGKEMYIELHDEVITDGWANAFFDDVVTYYETAPDASKHSDKAPDGHIPGEMAKLTYIPWVSVPKTSTEYANQIPNGDFETGNLSGWTIYGSGFPIKDGLPAADSASTYWDQELPFNKSGNYFVNGSALSGNEASTWRLRSTPFTLSGSGWISVKMGGHAAAVRVYKLDGTLVGDFDQSRFCDKDFPYISKGGSWNEMATYLLDLSQNIGDVLFIELCDDPIVGGWANAFFDDVVTYYPTIPVGKDEKINDGHQPGEKAKTVIIPTVVGMNNLYSPRNGGFELGNLTGWTLVEGNIKPDTAVLPIKDYNIDADLDKDDLIDELRKLPYNTSGNFIISGHDATWDEEDTWTLRSSPFTLAGSGYISVKMGGSSAAFRVRTVKDNKIIAHCDERRFNDINFPYISKGGSWRDMAVYVMDLSDYLGETLVIELMDRAVNKTWANSYFDDVIGYYAQRPTTKSDTVIDGYKEYIDEPKEIEIPWIYLDEFEDFRGQWPTTVALKGFTNSETPSEPPEKDDEGKLLNPDKQVYMNLYAEFAKGQNQSFQLEESKLTITDVKRYDSNGKCTGILGDYTNIRVEEGCYVVKYKLEQVGNVQTGEFNVLALPDNVESVFNGGFESGNMAGWTPLTDGFNSSTAVISDETYFETKQPYKHGGKYHLDGWNTGIAEENTWDVRSNTFTLSGSGYISWRMAGRTASLSVHLADSGAEIARVKTSNSLSASMTTYALDLSAYKGDKLYIELHDEEGLDNWAQAFFDEIVTNYDNGEDASKISDHGVVEQGAFYFTEEPANDILSAETEAEIAAAKAVNLTEIVNKEAKATYRGKPVDSLEIVNVKGPGSNNSRTRSVDPYAQYDMSTPGVYEIFYIAVYGNEKSPAHSFTITVYDEHSLPNGGFETGLDGWTVEGNAFGTSGVVSTDQRYWEDRAVYGWGKYYFDGASKEGETGTMSSTKFVLDGDGYISFMMGAGGNNAYVALCDGDTDEELIKVTNDGFKDPDLALTLLRVYMDASEYIGRTVYLKAVDNATGGFGFLCLDDFRVSLTRDEVRDLEEEQLEKVKNETYTSAKYDDLTNLRNYYDTYDYPVPPRVLTITKYAENQVVDCGTVDLTAFIGDVTATFAGEPVTDVEITEVIFDGTKSTSGFSAFDMREPGCYHVTYTATCNGRTAKATFTVVAMADHNSVANGGFEAGNLVGWTVVDGDIANKTPVISDTTYWGDTKMPYNQAGKYHLGGQKEQTGIDENTPWTVRSSNFELGGSGYISVRMGGKWAAVKVYKVNDISDTGEGTLVGHYKQTRFADHDHPNMAIGSWLDMGTYVMNLNDVANIGDVLYIELCAEGDNGWGYATFDEVVTYYETAPVWESSKETVDNSVGCEPEKVDIPWQLAENQLGSSEPKPEPDPADKAAEIAPTGAQVKNGGFENGTEGWTVTEGEVDLEKLVISAETYWPGQNAPYNQAGGKHLGGLVDDTGIAERTKWVVKSETFELQGEGYISVRMGGGYAAVKVYKADGTLIGYYKQNRFSDPDFPDISKGSWLDMGTYVMDLREYLGQDLYIELCAEEQNNGWGYATFDAVVTYYNDAPNWSDCGNTAIRTPWQIAKNLAETSAPAAPEGTQITNGGFEDGNLNGWTVLTPEGFNTEEAVSSAETWWNEQMPYNKAGNFHLDGWGTGIGEGDSWAVRSETFTLQGSGHISVRMGGNAAAVKVYKAGNNELVGYYKQTRFNDANFPNAAGGSWADMGTYVMDLSVYMEEELYIVLCDEGGGSWAHAFFDEVVTYYEAAPDYENMRDLVINGKGQDPAVVALPWTLVSSEPIPAAEGQSDEAEIPEETDAEETPDAGEAEADADAEPTPEDSAEPEKPTVPEVPVPEEPDETKETGESGEDTVDDEE